LRTQYKKGGRIYLKEDYIAGLDNINEAKKKP
jgi:hypothetical protein